MGTCSPEAVSFWDKLYYKVGFFWVRFCSSLIWMLFFQRTVAECGLSWAQIVVFTPSLEAYFMMFIGKVRVD